MCSTIRETSRQPSASASNIRVRRQGTLPPRRHEELPPPWITEERANERRPNHPKPVVERSTGAGDEDAGRRRGDVGGGGGGGGGEGVWGGRGAAPITG